MTCVKAQALLSSSASRGRGRFQATLHAPINPRNKALPTSIPNLSTMINMDKLVQIREEAGSTKNCNLPQSSISKNEDGALIYYKLYMIAEAVADRAEMHSIIGEQRNDWNKLFLSSINSITLTASLMSAINSSINPVGHSTLPLNLSSSLLFGAASCMMLLINKIQPSQLAEEQRKATQLFRQLEKSIQTTIALGAATESDVDEVMERMLAIDSAYPLPLLPLLEKFPKRVEPAVWWPKLKPRRRQQVKRSNKSNNGWTKELEEEMKGALRVLKAKDEEQYIEVGELAVTMNKAMAISGPVLAAIAAVGAATIGSSPSEHGQWPTLFAVVGGALATVVNTLEHGGQMGMVFELFRNCFGYYRNLEEEIVSNLGESDVDKREDGELFRLKMALHLGRSLSELHDLTSYADPSCQDEDIQEFAGKLF